MQENKGRLADRGLTAVVLIDDTFEEFEVMYPFHRFKEEGVEVLIVGHDPEWKYRGGYGMDVVSDKKTAQAVDPDGVDVLVVPGGWSREFITRSKAQMDLIRACSERGKLIAAICVGVRVVRAAGVTEGRKTNPGDVPVFRDGSLITSRAPRDVPWFCREIFARLEALAGVKA